jgi:hypothetical protein
MATFQGGKLLILSHSWFGKYAVGMPQLSVLTVLSPLKTSCGMSVAKRGQNQTLMNAVVRSTAYLQMVGNSQRSIHTYTGSRDKELPAPSTPIVVECRSIAIRGGRKHATTCVSAVEYVAVQSGRLTYG